MIEVHMGWKLTNVTVDHKLHGSDRFAYFTDKDGKEMRLRFGSLALTPDNKKRPIYEGNDLTDEHVIIITVSLFKFNYPLLYYLGSSKSKPIYSPTR